MNNYQKLIITSILQNSSIYYYEGFIESLKANDQTLYFPNIGSFYLQELNKFYYKINKVYLNPNLALSLDKGSIDYELLDALLQWKRVYSSVGQPYIGLRRKIYDNYYLTAPISIALFEENITFFNKYFKRVHFEQYVFQDFNCETIEKLKKDKIDTFWKKIYFWYYRKFKAIIFSIDFFAIGKKKYLFSFIREGWDFSSKDWIYGYNLKWDVPNELYKGDNIKPYILRNFQKIKYH